MKTLIHNIGILAGILPSGKEKLAGEEMRSIQTLRHAWLLIEDGLIKDFGDGVPMPANGEYTSIDAQGGIVMPCYCDPHTHIVYAGSREQEFEDKIRGLSYEEIARRGGGILNSADRLHEQSEEELFLQAQQRLNEMRAGGTGSVEIKSGYGLNTADELKMLRVIRRLRETSPLEIRATFLGAHAVGRAYQGRQSEYVDLVINEMIPEVGREGLADFIDVFCDEGFFTPEETARILKAGARYGLRPKIHAEELAASGGIAVAVEHNALSIDHLERMPDSAIPLLQQSDVMPTLLPGTSFFLNMPYAPARKLIDAGLPVALATDWNPGSTPSGSMKFILSLACIKQRLLPEEAINAATINAAYAMGLSQTHGSITRGKRAALQLIDAPSLAYLPYAYTSNPVREVIL